MHWLETLITFLSSGLIAWFVARLSQSHERRKAERQRRNQVLDEVLTSFEAVHVKVQDQFIAYDIFCDYSDRSQEWQAANSDQMLERREAAVGHLPDIRQLVGVIRGRLLFIGAEDAAHELSVYVDHADAAVRVMSKTSTESRNIARESRAAIKTCRRRFVDSLVEFAKASSN